MNPAHEADGQGGTLRVDLPGPLCTVQDLGRPGLAHLGVGRSGAADRGALIRANRLLGNADGAAALEITLGGARLTALSDLSIAITGASVPIAVDGEAAPGESALDLRAGQRIRLGRPAHGLRSYLAVRGGIDVPAVLGSRATDTLSGVGPAPVAAGDVLPIGRVEVAQPGSGDVLGSGTAAVEGAAAFAPGAAAFDPGAAWSEPTGTVVLDAVLGPRAEAFTDRAVAALNRTEWTVGREANRIGIHLDGPALERRELGELPSEGMVAGAVQVPRSGRPVVFLADHPVTGGYPVIAVLTAAAVDLAAQLRPGRSLRFRLVPGPLDGLA